MATFPVPEWIKSESYTQRPRSFGSSREHGKRLHAGCDLYAPQDSPVIAVADGVVICGPYRFYSGTYALEVNHGDFIVRYGEISSYVAFGIKAGAQVREGQTLGRIGHLQIKVHAMLHFEMYKGTAKGPLTQAGNKYVRRKDLMDPTPYLDSWLAGRPSGTALASGAASVNMSTVGGASVAAARAGVCRL